jgi:hypothetical protein
MLFLYRPRETWMPYRLPRNVSQQRAYNRQLQDRFDQTRQLAPGASPPEEAQRDPISALKELAQLHEAGALTNEEFTTAKSKLLDADDTSA